MPVTGSAVGLTLSTGRAVVVVLRGSRGVPEMVVRYEIALSDPWLRESLHPYHLELGNPTREAAKARALGCKAAARATRRAARSLVAEMRAHGLAPRGAGIAVRDLRDPARVTGAHPRAHAWERKLYREALEAALRESGLRVTVFEERRIRGEAVKRLRCSRARLDAVLKQFVRRIGTPWRASEKNAALAAWLALPVTHGR